MEASLIIALDERSKIHLTLETMELENLDAFMIRNFENSDEIRNNPMYKEKIEQFLIANENYRIACSRQNNGYIRVVYVDDNSDFVPIKAYYKKDKDKLGKRKIAARLKRKAFEDATLLKHLAKQVGNDLSDYYQKEIYIGLKYHIPTRYKNTINYWINVMANKKEGYFNLRMLDRHIEKYMIEHHDKINSTPIIPVKTGTIKNIDPVILNDDIVIKNDFDIKRAYYECASQDPEELFNVFDLDDIIKIDSDFEGKQYKK